MNVEKSGRLGLQELQAYQELLDQREMRGSVALPVTQRKGFSVLKGRRVRGATLGLLGHLDCKGSKEIREEKVKRATLGLGSPVSLALKERAENGVTWDYQGNPALKAAMAPKERKGK